MLLLWLLTNRHRHHGTVQVVAMLGYVTKQSSSVHTSKALARSNVPHLFEVVPRAAAFVGWQVCPCRVLGEAVEGRVCRAAEGVNVHGGAPLGYSPSYPAQLLVTNPNARLMECKKLTLN